MRGHPQNHDDALLEGQLPLLDELQRGRRALSQAFRRLRLKGLCGRVDVPQHRIAQSLQFRIVDSVQLDPKLQDCDRNQLRGIAIAVPDKGGLALFKGSQHIPQVFFEISHSVFPLPSQRDG